MGLKSHGNHGPISSNAVIESSSSPVQFRNICPYCDIITLVSPFRIGGWELQYSECLWIFQVVNLASGMPLLAHLGQCSPTSCPPDVLDCGCYSSKRLGKAGLSQEASPILDTLGPGLSTPFGRLFFDISLNLKTKPSFIDFSSFDGGRQHFPELLEECVCPPEE